MTPKTTEPKKERPRRTPEQIIADHEAEIARVRARQEAKAARALPEVQALVAALRGVDKAARVAADAGRDALLRALETARAGLGEQLVALGVRLPDRKAKRGGRGKKGAAA